MPTSPQNGKVAILKLRWAQSIRRRLALRILPLDARAVAEDNCEPTSYNAGLSIISLASHLRHLCRIRREISWPNKL